MTSKSVNVINDALTGLVAEASFIIVLYLGVPWSGYNTPYVCMYVRLPLTYTDGALFVLCCCTGIVSVLTKCSL